MATYLDNLKAQYATLMTLIQSLETQYQSAITAMKPNMTISGGGGTQTVDFQGQLKALGDQLKNLYDREQQLVKLIQQQSPYQRQGRIR